jgi:hypothetical protein
MAPLSRGTACYDAENLRQEREHKDNSSRNDSLSYEVYAVPLYGVPLMLSIDELCKKQHAVEATLKDCYDY